MITAEEAKKLALNNDQLIEAEMGRIENRITEAAGEGKFEVTVYIPFGILEKVIDKLEVNGFHVRKLDATRGKNGSHGVVIKWN